MNPFLWVIAFGAALFLVTFLPFDWWQKAPGRQKDKLIGKLLPFLNISLRNIVLRGLVIVYLLFIYLYLIIFLPALVALLMGGLILWSLRAFMPQKKRPPGPFERGRNHPAVGEHVCRRAFGTAQDDTDHRLSCVGEAGR